MKPSNLISLSAPVPSLFQIAAFFDDFFPSDGPKPPAAPAKHLPVAEYMLNPEKLMTLLKATTTENRPTATAEKTPNSTKRVTRNGSLKKSGSQNGSKSGAGSPAAVLKKVEFTLESPSANSVKLAGYFTDWERSPVEMMHSADGVWFTVVPLPPGSYSYRFIVDGEWCDDPRPLQRVRNPFGTENAIIHVA
jgi:hypothetical protein